MFCNNCGTEFEVTKIDNGKNRFCRSCGSLLYKNQNGQLIDSEGKPFINAAIDKNVEKLSIDEEHQKLLEQERLIKERQNQLLNQKREQELREQKERERIEQELLQKARQEQLIKDQQEQEGKEAERKEKERLLQLQREQEEKERLLREKIEKEIREKIQREQAEKERLERELKEKLERERIERELREAEEKKKAAQLLVEKEAAEKRQAEQSELEKAATAATLQTEQPSGGTFRKFLLFVLLPLLAAGILAGATYLLFPQQIKAALGINVSEAKVAEVTNTTEDTATDNTAIIEQLKTALTGKEVLSWGPIKADEIKELTIQSQQAETGNPSYVVELNLDDNAGTKAVAELDVSYTNNTIDKATTNKISYKNTAPVNAWFSFAPLKNCTILVNTNGNPIKLKGCQNCPSVSLNTSAEQPEKLINHPETIFIQSGSATETTVDFTYVPIK